MTVNPPGGRNVEGASCAGAGDRRRRAAGNLKKESKESEWISSTRKK
jgi:hypothetical protein